jgi:hypothetical protein
LPATAEPEAPSRRRRALLIASGTYRDPGLARLRAPSTDVRALAAVLGDETIGGFDVRQAIDESTENVKREIEGFFVDSRLDDLLLLYFSGHGVLSQSRRFYFATATTELKWLGSTAVDDRFVNEMMEHSRARTIVLILDCCHSGAFGRGLAPKSALTVDVEHRFEGQGRVTLSASTELEYAFEETDPATAISELEPAAPGSLFTSCLVEGLTTGEADIDEDGEVSLDELYEYLYRRVRERSPHQTPGRAGSVRGGIVIAKTRRRPALAGELLAASRSSLPAVRLGAAGELAKLLPSPQADLAAAAFRELERLERDDDHGVAVAAAAALGRPPPPPPAPSRRGRVRSAVALTGVAAIAVAATFVATLGGPTSGEGTVPYDFDGDGAQEIAIAPVQAGTATVLIHRGPDGEAPVPVSAAAAGLPGANEDMQVGAGIASADFNGDARADLVLGTPELEAVGVLYGTAEGVTVGRGTQIERNAAEVPSRRFGFTLLADDFNDDGFGDLVVGAPGAGEDAGSIQILFGSDAGLSTDGARTLDPPAADLVGFGAVLARGDIDGDDNVDLVVGSPDPSEGSTAGHLGFCAGAANGPAACRLLIGPRNDSGTSDLAVADVTGDGHPDIVQGDTELFAAGTGGVRLWLGGPEGPANTPLERTADELGLSAGGSGDDEFGWAVEAGRFDDDEFADVAVGIPNADEATGAVAILHGAGDGFRTQGNETLRWEGATARDRFGSMLSLLRLAGRDEPELVIAAEGASAEDSVLVRRDGFETLPGLGPAMKGGVPDELRLGRD